MFWYPAAASLSIASADASSGRRRGLSGRGALLLICLACTIAGLLARLHGLGDKPFWLDEVTTLRRSALPFGALVYDSLSFHHLPAWFVLSGWFLHIGATETAMRLPAALFGALSCGLAALAAGRLAGVAPALGAGMMMAFAPIEVQYGQEARSYTLVICLVLVALIGLIDILRDDGRQAQRTSWTAYVAGTLGGLWVLGVAVSWFVIANLVALSVLRGRRLRVWLAVQLAIGLAAAPGFVAMTLLVEQAHGTFQSGLDWIPRLAWPHVRITLESLYLMRISSLIADRLFHQPLPWLGLVVVLLAIAGIAAMRRRRRAGLVLAVCTLALPAGIALVSLVQPLFMPRYLLWSVAPFLVLAGCGLALLPPRAAMAAACALSLAAWFNLRPYYRIETKPRWEVAAQLLQAELKPGDLLLIDDPGAVDMMNVFLERRLSKIPDSWTTSEPQAACALHAGHRVWAVQGRVGQVDHEMLNAFLARIAPLGAPTETRRVGLDILLARFDPSGSVVACT